MVKRERSIAVEERRRAGQGAREPLHPRGGWLVHRSLPRKARISRRRCHATANRPRLDFHDVWLMMIVKLLFQRLG